MRGPQGSSSGFYFLASALLYVYGHLVFLSSHICTPRGVKYISRLAHLELLHMTRSQEPPIDALNDVEEIPAKPLGTKEKKDE